MTRKEDDLTIDQGLTHRRMLPTVSGLSAGLSARLLAASGLRPGLKNWYPTADPINCSSQDNFLQCEVSVDVVVEGKINREESMREVVQTVLELKTLANPVLRITDEESDLQGRIAFAQGGYIIGAKVNNTEELGYEAVRKLLSIRNGNYAVLDPGRTPFTDINQTLWLLGTRVIESLPNLPASPEALLDANPQRLSSSPRPAQESAQQSSATPITSVKSKSRAFNKSSWYMLQLVGMAVVALGLGGGILLYHDQIWTFFKTSLHL